MIAESLLGGALGSVMRLAPELLKFFDRKNEREHELRMLEREMDFAKIRGDIAMKQTEASMSIAELNAIGEAFKEQSNTAKQGGQIVSAISALVRPMVTYWFVLMYSIHKIVHLVIASENSAQDQWLQVLAASWTEQDWTVLAMILSFWFVGRVWERQRGQSN